MVGSGSLLASLPIYCHQQLTCQQPRQSNGKRIHAPRIQLAACRSEPGGNHLEICNSHQNSPNARSSHSLPTFSTQVVSPKPEDSYSSGVRSFTILRITSLSTVPHSFPVHAFPKPNTKCFSVSTWTSKGWSGIRAYCGSCLNALISLLSKVNKGDKHRRPSITILRCFTAGKLYCHPADGTNLLRASSFHRCSRHPLLPSSGSTRQRRPASYRSSSGMRTGRRGCWCL